MQTLISAKLIHAPQTRCFDLARSVEVHLKGNRHWGEQAVAAGGVTSGLIGLNDRVTWCARHFGVRQRLTSQITAFAPFSYFQDTMLQGAFAFMRHDHHFRAVSPSVTEMTDVFEFAAPLGVLGRLAERLVLRRYMQALLEERNSIIQQVAESEQWRLYLPTEDV